MYCENCTDKIKRLEHNKTRASIKEAILFSSKSPKRSQKIDIWAFDMSNRIDDLLANSKAYDINFHNLQQCVKGSEFHRYCLYLENLLNEEGARIRHLLGIDGDTVDVPKAVNLKVVDHINKLEMGNEKEETIYNEVGN